MLHRLVDMSTSMSAHRRRVYLAFGSLLMALTIYVAVANVDAGRLDRHLPGWLPSSVKGCDPYTQNGYLNFDPTNAHANRWTPYDSECQAPALLASFLKATWADKPPAIGPRLGTQFTEHDVGPDGREWKDMEWARGRSVVIYGDSISRFMSGYFCHMAGEQYIEIGWSHNFSAPVVEKFPDLMPEEERVPEQRRRKRRSNDGGHDHKTQAWNKVDPGSVASHRPHYCYVPGLDFLMVHSMFFGLDQSQFWRSKEEENPPYTYEERLEMLAVPILENIRKLTGRTSSAPELTYIHSGMWDVARFVREDIVAKENPEDNLSRGRLNWYRTRVRQILVTTGEKFPQTTIKWLSTHYPLRISNGWFFEGKRPEIKLNRLVELHQAALSAFEDTSDATPQEEAQLARVTLNNWGLMMRGMEQHQVDDLHPDLLPGGYLWADYMLHDLQKAVSSWGSRWRMLGQ